MWFCCTEASDLWLSLSEISNTPMDYLTRILCEQEVEALCNVFVHGERSFDVVVTAIECAEKLLLNKNLSSYLYSLIDHPLTGKYRPLRWTNDPEEIEEGVGFEIQSRFQTPLVLEALNNGCKFFWLRDSFTAAALPKVWMSRPWYDVKTMHVVCEHTWSISHDKIKRSSVKADAVTHFFDSDFTVPDKLVCNVFELTASHRIPTIEEVEGLVDKIEQHCTLFEFGKLKMKVHFFSGDVVTQPEEGVEVLFFEQRHPYRCNQLIEGPTEGADAVLIYPIVRKRKVVINGVELCVTYGDLV